jgi:molybdopterin-guanine dinucleotide biosynthesis protein A
MGSDKALLRVDGVAMAQRVADAVSGAGCSPVVAIGGDAARLSALGLRVVADRWPGEGPVGGVLTALLEHPDADAVVVVACDLPDLSSATVHALVDALGADPEAAAAAAVTDRVQPLCVAWRPSAAPILTAAMDRGERRLHVVLAELGCAEVQVDPRDLANVNSPGDLPSRL